MDPEPWKFLIKSAIFIPRTPQDGSMILGAMQPIDLKKVFAKMESREYSKLHRTAKWIHCFLERAMDDVLIYVEAFIHLHLTFSTERNGLEVKIYRSSKRNADTTAELATPLPKDMSLCKTNFQLRWLNIDFKFTDVDFQRINDKMDELVLYLAKNGIKRVNTLEICWTKPTKLMFATWKPSHVYISAPLWSFLLTDWWNKLSDSEESADSEFESGIEILARYCKGVEFMLFVRAGDDVILERTAKHIKKFHTNTLLDTLILRIILQDDLDLDRFFPSPLSDVIMKPPEGEKWSGISRSPKSNGRRFFFWMIHPKSALLVQMWCSVDREMIKGSYLPIREKYRHHARQDAVTIGGGEATGISLYSNGPIEIQTKLATG